MPVYNPKIYDDTAIAKQLRQEKQYLKQALTASQLMTEHYRRLLVDTYAELGLLKSKNNEHVEKEKEGWGPCYCSVDPEIVKCPYWYCEGGG